MYTLLLPGRSHVIRDGMAEKLILALENHRAVEWIRVEMNGEGSGEWDVAINVGQIVALVKHPAVSPTRLSPPSGLRLVPTTQSLD